MSDVIILEPCPFCGGKVDFSFNIELEPDGIRCGRCKFILRYPRIRITKNTEPFSVVMDKMANEWNKRAKMEEAEQ